MERLNHLAAQALDTLEDALQKPGSVGVNAAKAVLEWREKIIEQEKILKKLEELEQIANDKYSCE